MVMDLARFARHLVTGPRRVRRCFPQSALDAIEAAIGAGELRHAGELRFAVEAALHPFAALRGYGPRERAIEVFSALHVCDTAQHTGVLIYLLLADRDIEIVADRGIAERVRQEEWEAICRAMETEMRAGRYEAGALAGIHAVSDLLARHFPPGERNPDELPDRPVLL
jgi:uncharacterized membrane protein